MFPENLPPHNIRLFWHRRLFWVVCGIPTLLSAFYLFIWATPRYESEAIIRVYEAGRDASSSERSSIDGMAGGSIVSPGAYVLQSYISSWDIFHSLHLDDLRKEWSRGDLFTRFGGIQSFLSHNDMRLWNYYKLHLKGEVNEISGLITITADGYNSTFPHELLTRVIHLAQVELAQSGIKADQAERELLVKRLEVDKQKMALDLRNIQALQKAPGNSMGGGIFSDYKAVLEHKNTDIPEVSNKADATAFIADRTQQIVSLQGHLNAIDDEIGRKEATLSKKSEIYYQFNRLQKQISEDAQVILLDDKSLLESEQNSIRHAYYMDFIENPIEPTNATLPHAFYWLVGIMFGSFVLYLIIK